MLTLKLPMEELWDSFKGVFIEKGSYGIFEFEHSLSVIAEWETEYKQPFLTNDKKSVEEMKTYIQMMCTTDLPIDYIDGMVMHAVADYINDDLSATRITNVDKGPSKIITSEVLYAYMVEAGIPFEADHWHLSRLLKLIEVIGSIRNPPKKMSQSEIMAQNKRLNEERRRKFNSKG